MGGKPNPGTSKDKRLAANKKAASPSVPFGGKKAAPFGKKGGKKK